MNQTAAENFINSLVRNLQVLCHSNVEFRNDIEVVGHLYLKVDRQKKFNYIVDEKVCKNDASSTVFVSNSYHSENQSKKNLENENRENQKDADSQLSNSNNSHGNFSNKPDDNKRLSQSINEGEPVKKSKKSVTHQENFSNRHRSTPQTPQTSSTSTIKSEPIVDLSRIKREPSIDEDENLPCFFPSQISQHSSTSSPTKESNFHDTGQNIDTQSMHLFQSSQSAILPHVPSQAVSTSSTYHSTPNNNGLIEVEYVTSRRGTQQVLFQDHLHNKNSTRAQCIHWKCVLKTCNGRVTTVGNYVRNSTPHNHAPQEPDTVRFVSNMRKRAREELTPMATLYQESVAQLDLEVVPNLPSYASLRSSLYRHRQHTKQALTLSRVDMELEEKVTETDSADYGTNS